MLEQNVALSAGHIVKLLVRPNEGLLPIPLSIGGDCIQVFAREEVDPDGELKFNTKRAPLDVFKVHSGFPAIGSDWHFRLQEDCLTKDR